MAARGWLGVRQRLLARAIGARLFSSNRGGNRAWRNVTPEGSNTEVFVYSPESNIVWPDPNLGVLNSQTDPNFLFPGNIGQHQQEAEGKGEKLPKSELGLGPTSRAEAQVGALHQAHDFIKYTPGAESVVLGQEQLVERFPALLSPQEEDTMELAVHEAPLLLRKAVRDLFPSQDFGEGPLSLLTVSIRTVADMSMWSQEMEDERESVTSLLVSTCKELCSRVKEEGYFSDFIDPCSGTPHYSAHSSTTLSETDERLRLLGLRIEDLGCCKVISHHSFGRHVIVGIVVTNAPKGVGVLQDIILDIQH